MALAAGSVIWITRTRPGVEATRERILAARPDLCPLIDPVLEVCPRQDADLSDAIKAHLSGAAQPVLAITSQNALTLFARLCPRRDLNVFTVGDASQAQAQSLGFSSVSSAGGTVTDLKTLILDRTSPETPILFPHGTQQAGDLLGELSAAGRRAKGLCLYETRPTQPHLALTAPRLDALILHSPRGAQAVVTLSQTHQGLRGLPAFALSEAVAGPLHEARWQTIFVPPFPNDAALLNLVL